MWVIRPHSVVRHARALALSLMASATFIALVRGINVGGRNQVPMVELRALAADLGWVDVRSFIQSGNLVFRAADNPMKLASELEAALQRRYGFAVAVIIRADRDWSGYLESNPFPEASEKQPGLVMLALSKDAPKDGAAAEISARATLGERVRQVGDAIWIHYAGGAGRSRLSPGSLDRAVGSAVTTRNWRTVRELAKMAGIVGG